MSSSEPEQTVPTTTAVVEQLVDPEAGVVPTPPTTPQDAENTTDLLVVVPEDNEPFYKKLTLVAFVAVLLLGAVSVDQYIRHRTRLIAAAGKLQDPQQLQQVQFTEGKPAKQLRADEEYFINLVEKDAREQADGEDGQYVGNSLPATNTYQDSLMQFSPSNVGDRVRESMRPVFSLLGSESGTYTRVIYRRLKDLAHLAMLVGFSMVIYHVWKNPSSAEGFRPTTSAPLTGLTHLEKMVFMSLSGLAVLQCLSQLYSPSWLTFVPTIVTQILSNIRSTAIDVYHYVTKVIENIFADYSHPSSRANNPLMALLLSIRHAWKESLIRRAFRRVVPEGTLGSLYRFIRKNYGHVIYAPLWMGLLLGFHMLYVYDPTALSKMVQSAIPWVVPETVVKGVVVWAGQTAASVATSQPIYATIGTWIFVSFGIGGLVRPWSYKKADGQTVSKYDYYKCNRVARWLHLIAGITCLSLLVMCYLPYTHTLVQALTGLPLQEAMNAAWAVTRSALWVGIQTAVRSCRVMVDAMRALQWPATSGFVPFLFTMSWNSLTIFAFYAIPKVVQKICDHHKLWRYVNGLDDDERKRNLRKKLNAAVAFYTVVVVLVSMPMLVSIFSQVFTLFNFTAPVKFLMTPVYSYVYTLGPIMFIPPYMILMAFQYGWIMPRDDFQDVINRNRTLHHIKSWFWPPWPALKLLFAGFMTILFYTFVFFVFHFDYIPGFFHFLDGIAGSLMSLVMWVVSSLTQNMSWVAPFTWTFGTAGAFSLLLVFMPTFLDSCIGGLLYLPAWHFLGQVLLMWCSAGLNVPTALLIGGFFTFHVLTALALLIRNWEWSDDRSLVWWLVPWHDEFRGLVADD